MAVSLIHPAPEGAKPGRPKAKAWVNSVDDFQTGAAEEFLADANNLDGFVSFKDWQSAFAQHALRCLGENHLRRNP